MNPTNALTEVLPIVKFMFSMKTVQVQKDDHGGDIP